LIVQSTTFALPTNQAPVFKLGIEYKNASVNSKFLANLRTTILEHNFTYQARPNLVVGWNTILDPRVQNLQ